MTEARQTLVRVEPSQIPDCRRIRGPYEAVVSQVGDDAPLLRKGPVEIPGQECGFFRAQANHVVGSEPVLRHHVLHMPKIPGHSTTHCWGCSSVRTLAVLC